MKSDRHSSGVERHHEERGGAHEDHRQREQQRDADQRGRFAATPLRQCLPAGVVASRHGRAWGRTPLFEPVEPIEHGQRFVGRRALRHRRLQQTTGLAGVAAIEGCYAVLQQLLRFPLPLGQCAACPFDVRPRPRMAPIEKQRACPDVDGLLVLCGEIVVQTGEQELLDLRIPIRFRRSVERMSWVVAKRVGHKMSFEAGEL